MESTPVDSISTRDLHVIYRCRFYEEVKVL